MTPRFSAPMRLAAVGAATVVVGVVASSPALASGNGDVKVTNTETVQIYTSPTGEIQTKRVYEQLALVGQGKVDISNPVSTDGLRNLDGFGGFTVKGGNQILDTTVNGEKRLRSVSNYDSKPPLDVSVAYKLDGRNVKPGDVVGKSGHLEVRYTVKNVTGVPQQLTFDDGHGGTVTKTVDVPIPMVGSLDVTAPSSFTHVTSEAANMAGDGKGGTKMSFTMTLFPPIGSDTAVFGYDADITDGVIPRAEISALPVNPLQSPTFKSAAGSYQGGADSGIQLSTGATTIDENLLKLRDGAAQLLGGLLQLRDGAQQLQAGLSGQAVPGAQQLATGAGQLATGAGQLDDGLGKLKTGSGELYAGTAKAAAGGHKLHKGAGKLSTGLDYLTGGAAAVDAGAGQILDGQKSLRDGLQLLESGVQTLPASVRDQLAGNAQYLGLLAGMQGVVDGIGKTTDVTDPSTGQPATLFGGLNAVKYGLRSPYGYTGTDCIVALAGGTPTKCGAMDAVQLVSSKLSDAAKSGGSLDQLSGAARAVYGYVVATSGGTCPALVGGFPPAAAFADPTTACYAAASVVDGLDAAPGTPGFTSGGVKEQTYAAGAALANVYGQVDAGIAGPGAGIDRIKAGLNNPNADPNCAVGAATATKTDDCGVQQAVSFFKASIPVLVDSITANISKSLLSGISVPATGCDPAAMTLLCGANALVSGSGDLKAGTSLLAAGSGQLDAGGQLLYGKLGELSTGLDKIDGGAGLVYDGATKASDGAGKVSDGSGKLSAGAQKLAVGLGDAANGSGKLADGLRTAAKGAPKLVNGAQKLSTQGTKKLVAAGEDTAQNYGEQYAVFKAGAERASTSSMAFGAPAGAIGLTAYSYVIQGDDGESGRNWTRGAGGLALLGAGGVLFALRRRFI